MARPPLSDWESVFGFSEDPTPGNPEVLEELASEYRSIAHNADGAFSVVSRLDSNDLGEGKSMDKLRDKLGELPEQVRKLHTSYEVAADAIARFALQLRDAQEQADRALEQGREAKERLAVATLTAAAAGAHVQSLDNEKAPPPDDHEARSSARKALADARQAESDAARSVDAAQSELDAARMLAVDAEEIRVSHAGMAKRKLEEAEDDAVAGKSIWEKFLDILGMVFGIVGAILGVIAMFITGPVGLLLAAGSLALGAASLGITIGKAIKTGNVDIAGIILGTLGLAFGGFSVFQAAKGLGGLSGLGKVGGASNWFKGGTTNPFSGMKGGLFKSPRGAANVAKNGSPPKFDMPPKLPELQLEGGATQWAHDTLMALSKPLPGPGAGALNVTPSISGVQRALDGTSLAATVAGVIYTPISFDGKSQAAVQREGDYPMVPWS